MGKREIWLGTELNRQRQPFRATEIVLAVTYKDLEGCETPVKTCKNEDNGRERQARILSGAHAT
jgi:hypothetical protein